VGELRLADGMGPLVGDEGSGSWMGRAGLVAVVRAHQGRGPQTALCAAAADVFGAGAAEIAARIGVDSHPARAMAAFAPDVLAAWVTGDAVAADIVEHAVAHLDSTAHAACDHLVGTDRRLAVVGGLAAHTAFRTLLLATLSSSLVGTEVMAPLGGPLDGAALMCADRVPAVLAALGG
jgi:N-acetylglucosamine kinase-like BadF-type ATPase